MHTHGNSRKPNGTFCSDFAYPDDFTAKRRKIQQGRKLVIPKLPVASPRPPCVPPLPVCSKPVNKKPGQLHTVVKKPLSGRAKLLHEARLERERKEAKMSLHPIATLGTDPCEVMSVTSGDALKEVVSLVCQDFLEN
jgi:hypothetical protein